MALSRYLQVSTYEDFTTTPALESTPFNLFTLSYHFHFILYYDTFMSTFHWTHVFMLCFDNGGVHNLLVGSEPIYCSYCLYYVSTGFKLIYPTLGGIVPYF